MQNTKNYNNKGIKWKNLIFAIETTAIRNSEQRIHTHPLTRIYKTHTHQWYRNHDWIALNNMNVHGVKCVCYGPKYKFGRKMNIQRATRTHNDDNIKTNAWYIQSHTLHTLPRTQHRSAWLFHVWYGNRENNRPRSSLAYEQNDCWLCQNDI